jgi:hypothetical protein
VLNVSVFPKIKLFTKKSIMEMADKSFLLKQKKENSWKKNMRKLFESDFSKILNKYFIG